MKSTMILAAWLLWELVQWRECGELGLPVHPLGQMASVCSEMQIIWGHQLVAAVGPQEVSRMASRAPPWSQLGERALGDRTQVLRRARPDWA